MTRYMILISGDEARWDALTPAETAEIDEGHAAFRERVGDAIESSGQLAPSRDAVTLRSPGGKLTRTDGPYAESGEVLGGYYVVHATDRDEVIAWASGLAEAKHNHSVVQVWPLVDHGADG